MAMGGVTHCEGGRVGGVEMLEQTKALVNERILFSNRTEMEIFCKSKMRERSQFYNIEQW